MSNKSGKSYSLTALCPIINGSTGDQSYASITREILQNLDLDENSPMAKVANTYLCRFFILNDVFYESSPSREEHLKSKYIVFSSNFHGDLDSYLQGMWNNIEEDVKQFFQYGVAFDKVHNAKSFVKYIKNCQVKNSLFFNGSSDESLDEQLKGLYLKQEFTQFAYDNQGKDAESLQQAFQDFVKRTEPSKTKPTWLPGSLGTVVSA